MNYLQLMPSWIGVDARRVSVISPETAVTFLLYVQIPTIYHGAYLGELRQLGRHGCLLRITGR